jgi:probable rRNA maturation factor
MAVGGTCGRKSGEMPHLPPPNPVGPPLELGDLALAFETCAREAAEADKALKIT